MLKRILPGIWYILTGRIFGVTESDVRKFFPRPDDPDQLVGARNLQKKTKRFF